MAVTATGIILVVGAYIVWLRYSAFDRLGLVGIDLEIYQGYAQRWLETGSMYDPSQLAGPYNGQPYVQGPIPPDMPSMYPPVTVLLFAPFLVLPHMLWWAVPIGALVAVLVWLRPSVYVTPFVILPLVTPEAAAGYVAGNTGMWLVAGVAAGIRWGWPSLILGIKPFLAPFALVGARQRNWWLGALALALLMLLMLSEWVRYPTVVANAYGLNYDLGNVPSLLSPIVAWLTGPHRPNLRTRLPAGSR